MKPFVIGISGASCSGKTLIAKNLADKLTVRENAVIHMDSYYHDLGDMKPEEKAWVNFDIPEAIDFDLLENHVEGLLEGREVLIPEYNFKTHTRKPVSEGKHCKLSVKNRSRPVIIIEGLHVLFKKSLRELMDICVFIDTGMDICFSRRVERDTKKRGRTREDVYRQFNDTVIPMYEKYVLPTREYASLIVDGEKAAEKSVKDIIRKLESTISD
ncbi:uridine kinase [bacterium]|nr:uridine kinase [bacterium]